MVLKNFDKELFKREVMENVKLICRKPIEEATEQEVFQAVCLSLKDTIVDNWITTHKSAEANPVKELYYLSMEFLMGRALGNNLINLGCNEEVREAMEELGFHLNALEDQEPDPALGNGGLGRLAACFLDSLATLGYMSYGCGIRYHYGMFAQKIVDGYQVEVPDEWLKNGNPFEVRRNEYACEVRFGGYVRITYDEKAKKNRFFQEGYQAVRAVPYDMPIIGYRNDIVDTLRIWEAEPLVSFDLSSFDKGDYKDAVLQENLAKNIVEVLYPNDNHYAGKELRLKQQYFFISATIQTALKKFKSRFGRNFHDLPNRVVFHMNDTHPTVTVAELMRILIDEENLEWEDAWEITTKTCAYTNHTIMSEALEKWPVDLFSRLLPRIYQIVEEINRRFLIEVDNKFMHDVKKSEHMAILFNGQVHMAHLAIVGSFSVNGVAKLHTDILKNVVLKDFYEMYPEKFNNKTNGITQRRFLLHANPLLSKWITERIGDNWVTNFSDMELLKPYAENREDIASFMEIKRKNKLRLAEYIEKHNGVKVSPDSIFDVQVKRLHEYKRQLLNILHVMYLYNMLKKNPDMPYHPVTFIFGAKAAAGYRRAKLTIKLINSVADVINNDPEIKGKLKVVFIENYRVSNAELIFAAADVSEQISTASKEASGTGNMKLMANGAVTLGTMDGANVEIVKEVGEENAFIFGLSSEEVIQYEQNGGYDPKTVFDEDEGLREVMMQLVNGYYAPDDSERFRDIYQSLLYPTDGSPADPYFILKDFRSYHEAHMRVQKAYENREAWGRMALLNTASCGLFSSDRTIQEYVDEIWKLEPIVLNP